ncbi:PKD domain-containing protein [Methanoregula sp.]|uniref:PKD domain-containing protein n=1 Tax=Methanoregula sp. TaxID=2052170 RepID=UPI002B77744C|nr:PKD domain-containing protein [Methanoregula sp.]HVP96343.1 PKD domain-containing protein [Methanoregula sp.]
MKITPFFCIVVLFVCGIGITCPALGAVPVASFISNASSGNVPLTVQFVDSSLNSPTSWTWLFGDGGISTLQNPSHIYTTPGTYTVTLIAANSAGTNTATYQGYVTATKAASVPVVSFVTNVTAGSPPFTVQFLDTSTNSPASWVWSFGDGGTSASPNPVHTYTSSGSFTVTLTATNAAGSNTTSMSNYITILPVTVVPTAIFKTTITSGYEPLTVQFVDASTNSPNSWVWSFGDGGTSTLQNPSHTYTAAGSYTVTLTASNIVGSNTVSQPGYITVNAAMPAAAFTSNVTSGTNPLSVQFIDTTNNTPTGWYWTFGDGGTSTLQNPIHTFTTVGSYAVSLGATNSAGSNTTTMPAYITVSNALSAPSSSFSADIRSGNAPLTVQFQDTSSNSPNGWQWLFGDGSTSTDQNPMHTYTTAGSYSVSLTTVNPGGHNTTVMPGFITVAEPFTTATPTMAAASTTFPTAQGTTAQPAQTPSSIVTNATSAPAGTSPSWTLPLIGIVILVLAGIAYILHSRGRSGGRRHSGRREL